MKYYLIAGEASGDLHAANLMRELRVHDPEAEFRFLGGDLMKEQGGTLVKHYREMAFMGFIPVIANLDKVLANIRLCKNDMTQWRPDCLILIDYPGFNLKMARYAKEKLKIPVFYYISPKIWAWKEYRIHDIKKYVDRMLCILPFETGFYAARHYPVEYVGNPTVDELAVRPDAEETFQEFRRSNDLSDKPVIALLAGSRQSEIKSALPVMLEGVSAFTDYQPVIAGAPGISAEFYNSVLSGRSVPIVFGKTYRLLQQSSVALVTSGTATLETALLSVPQVVCYKIFGGRAAYELFKRILKVKYVSLVNLIADEEVVKELLVQFFTPENVEKELRSLLEDAERRNAVQAGYARMRARLGAPGAAKTAAKAIVKEMKEKQG